MEQEYSSIDLRELLWLLKKNLMPLLVCILWGAIGALALSKFVLRPQYQAATTLVVNAGDAQATAVTNDQINSARQLVNTYAVLLTNDALLDEIIGVYGMQDTVESLKKRIAAEAVEQTQVMRITMRDEDPALALAVLNTMVERAPAILMETVKAGSVEIVSPPRVEAAPVFPRIWLNTFIGGAAGFVFCLLVLLVRGMLVKPQQQIQKSSA